MTETKAERAAKTVKHWLTEHPGRAAAARFPIDELWTLLDERSEMIAQLGELERDGLRERIAVGCDKLAEFYDHPDIWPEGSQHPDALAAHAMRHAYRTAARLIRAGGIPEDEPGPDELRLPQRGLEPRAPATCPDCELPETNCACG